jgi:hypothetical protein
VRPGRQSLVGGVSLFEGGLAPDAAEGVEGGLCPGQRRQTLRHQLPRGDLAGGQRPGLLRQAHR